MSLSKPSWLEWLLDAINLRRGEWVDITIPIPFVSDIHLDIPPFSFPIGDWIESALDAVLDVVDAALDGIRAVMATAADIYQAGISLLEQVGSVIQATAADLWGGIDDVYGRVTSGLGAVYDFVNSGLQEVRQYAWDLFADVSASIYDQVAGVVDELIDAALDGIRAPINLVNQYFDEMVDLFSDPLEWLFSKFTQMIERFW